MSVSCRRFMIDWGLDKVLSKYLTDKTNSTIHYGQKLKFFLSQTEDSLLGIYWFWDRNLRKHTFALEMIYRFDAVKMAQCSRRCAVHILEPLLIVRKSLPLLFQWGIVALNLNSCLIFIWSADTCCILSGCVYTALFYIAVHIGVCTDILLYHDWNSPCNMSWYIISRIIWLKLLSPQCHRLWRYRALVT